MRSADIHIAAQRYLGRHDAYFKDFKYTLVCSRVTTVNRALCKINLFFVIILRATELSSPRVANILKTQVLLSGRYRSILHAFDRATCKENRRQRVETFLWLKVIDTI